jgi:hypothetical protein
MAVGMESVYTRHMPRANVPADEKTPKQSPIFPHLAIGEIAKLEVHIQYKDRDGDTSWADAGEFAVYASWEDIRKRCGGGYYKVGARGAGGRGYIGQIKKRLAGPPKFLNEIRSAEENEDEITSDEPLDESLKLVHATIAQQSAILPAAFETLTTAMVQAAAGAAERGVAMAERMEAMVRNHASTLESLRTIHAAELATREAQLERERAKVADLEGKIEKLTTDNIGYLRSLNTASGPDGWVRTIKELSPELPKFKGVFKEMAEAFRGTGAGGPAKQLPASNPVPDTRAQFGGD